MKINELFDHAQKLPTIPKIVQELIASFSDEDINLAKIGGKIALDQVITAKVLRLANCARYGLPRKVTSVNDAVVLLGFNTLRTLVLASGVTGAFPETGGLKKRDFWSGSFNVATAAKVIAQNIKTPVNAEVAFTCGMLHNIGELLMHVVMPKQMEAVAAAIAAGGERQATQQSMLGFDYTQVGAELASRWNFPAEIQQAIDEQCDPLKGDYTSPLSCILALAIALTDYFNSEQREQVALPDELASALGVDLSHLIELETTIAETAASFEELLA